MALDRRLAAIEVTPELVFRLLQIKDLIPDAEYVGATHDFDSDLFKIKFTSEEFPALEEGGRIPYLDVTLEGDYHMKSVKATKWGFRDGA